MPIWKFQPDGGGGDIVELEDASLNLQAYRQSIEDILFFLRAHDGEEFEDISTSFIAAGYSVEDAVFTLDALYQSLEDAGIDLSTWGTDYKNLKSWLAAYILATDSNATTDMATVATSYEYFKTLLSLVATGYKDLKTYLQVLGLSITCLPSLLNAVGYNLNDNINLYLAAASKTVYGDIRIFLWASNGLVTEHNMGLCLMATRGYRAAYAGTYQRVSSVVRRLT